MKQDKKQMESLEDVREESSIASTIEAINKGEFTPGDEPSEQRVEGEQPANQQSSNSSQRADEKRDAGNGDQTVEKISGDQTNANPEKGGEAITNPFFDEGEKEEKAAPPQETNEQNTTSPEIGEDVIFDRLREMTGGAITSKDALTEKLNQLSEAQERLSKPAELKFPNERAREIYELAVNQDNLEGAKSNFYRELGIMAIDTDKISDKEALYQAFLLDPSSDAIPEDKKKSYFDLQFKRKYSGLDDEDSESHQDDKLMYEIEAAKAKRTLKEAQDGYLQKRQIIQEADPEMEEKSRRINDGISGYWNSSEGIDFDFNSDDAETPDANKIFKESFTPEQKEMYEKMTKSPSLLIQNKIKEYTDENGNLDVQGYANWTYLAANVIPMLQKMQNFGYGLGKAAEVITRGNAQVVTKTVQPNVAAPEGPRSLAEAWGKAKSQTQNKN